MINKKLFKFFILLPLALSILSCKKSITLINKENLCPLVLNSQSDTTFKGICTIYLKDKSLKGEITVAIRDEISKVIMMDELGVPLLITSDSLNVCNLIRRFPPLSDEDAFITGLAITASLRKNRSAPNRNSACHYSTDLKDSTTLVYYGLKDNEKDLTKIVHNNDFYNIHHKENNENLLVNLNEELLAKFTFNNKLFGD